MPKQVKYKKGKESGHLLYKWWWHPLTHRCRQKLRILVISDKAAREHIKTAWLTYTGSPKLLDNCQGQCKHQPSQTAPYQKSRQQTAWALGIMKTCTEVLFFPMSRPIVGSDKSCARAVIWLAVDSSCMPCSISWMCQSYWNFGAPSDQERPPRWKNHPAEEWVICIAVVPNASTVHPRLCALCSYLCSCAYLC